MRRYSQFVLIFYLVPALVAVWFEKMDTALIFGVGGVVFCFFAKNEKARRLLFF